MERNHGCDPGGGEDGAATAQRLDLQGALSALRHGGDASMTNFALR
jgi:hypothetical protein